MKKIWVIFLVLLWPALSWASGVDINTAALSELDQIKGVGPVLAQRIVDARPFSSLNDLLRVKGIGEKTLQDIKNQGLACISCAAQKTEESPNKTPNQAPSPQIAGSEGATTPSPAENIVYPAGIFFNEILPSPKGPDETDEWIELFNANDSGVDLSGWKISDVAGSVKIFAIPKNTIIAAQDFLVLKRPDTKIMLNNDGDGLILFYPNGKTADSVNFAKAPTGQSYNKISGGWTWSAILTSGSKNIISASQSKTNSNALSKEKNSVKNNDAAMGLASLSQSIDLNRKNGAAANYWFLFFVVLAITIILAGAVLFVKVKFRKHKT